MAKVGAGRALAVLLPLGTVTAPESPGDAGAHCVLWTCEPDLSPCAGGCSDAPLHTQRSTCPQCGCDKHPSSAARGGRDSPVTRPRTRAPRVLSVGAGRATTGTGPLRRRRGKARAAPLSWHRVTARSRPRPTWSWSPHGRARPASLR